MSRFRGPWPPWPSDGAWSDFFSPVDVSFLIAHRWCMLVKTWQLDVDVSFTAAGGGHFVESGPVSWNHTNFYGASGSSPGNPADEEHLGLGWQITSFGVGLVSSVDFFQSGYGFSGLTAGRGMEWSDPANIVKPFMRIVAGNGQTKRGGTSAVVCTVDGITVPWFDEPPYDNAGTVDFYPIEYWEYRRGDGTNPMYDATTGAPLLGRQTDEPA